MLAESDPPPRVNTCSAVKLANSIANGSPTRKLTDYGSFGEDIHQSREDWRIQRVARADATHVGLCGGIRLTPDTGDDKDWIQRSLLPGGLSGLAQFPVQPVHSVLEFT